MNRPSPTQPLRRRLAPAGRAMRWALLLLAPLARASAPTEPLFETACVFPATPDNRPNHRIPALLQTPGGDLLAFAERRNDGPGDVGDHDLVCKRSRDRGATWGVEQVILDDGARTCTDVTVGIDRNTRRIWLFFLRDKKDFAHMTSDDDGSSWQGPISIHSQVTRPGWDTLAPGRPARRAPPPAGRRVRSAVAAWAEGWHQRYGLGPGNAMIQLRAGPRAGRLLVPARHREDVGGGRLRSFSHAFWSDDGGATWRLGASVGPDTSECQLAERVDGAILLIARDESATDAPDNLRHRAALSRDGGETWSAPRRVEELITPRCHGALERIQSTAPDGGDRMLFCNPAAPFRQPVHPYGRTNLTVRLSMDGGRTWSAGRTIWPHPASYSDIAALDDGTVGLVYERGSKGGTHYWDEIQFARFDLAWVTPDAGASTDAPAGGR